MNLEELVKELLIRVELLSQRVKELEVENKELHRRLNQDSNNSSKPPSSDSIFKKSERPRKGKNGKRKRGAQPGHKGNKLVKSIQVDHKISHPVACCPSCLCKDLEILNTHSKQVLDIPIPKIEVTEHLIYNYNCNNCGEKVSSPISKELKQEAQYGSNIKALVNYLNVYQLIPYKRLTELIEVLYGHKISQGSISNFNKEMSNNLSGFVAQVKASLSTSSSVIHGDETGCMVSKILHWVHVCCDKTRTLLQGHANRGRQAMDDMGILEKSVGVLIHDRWSSYNYYEHITHGLCNAHIIRELKSIEENQQLSWASKIKKQLLRAKEYKDQNNLDPNRARRLQKQYEAILRKQRPYYQEIERQLKLAKPKGWLKRSKDHNLFKAMWKYRNEILLFIYREDVPFDNNQAERDLRMLKVKMKISNHFQSLDWLNVHATIKSYISTAQKKKLDIFKCIQNAHQNPELATLVGV